MLRWIATSLVLLFSVLVSSAAADAKRPNILFILADDMGYSDLGCYGGEIATPNLDRLAANGLRFTSFYNTSRCWPTRAAVLTGYYPQQIRMDPPMGRLPRWTRLLPHYLKPLGYRSYHSGKWHVNGAPRVIADGGFDRSYRLEDHDRHFSPQNHGRDDQPLPPVARDPGYYTTIAITDFMIDCLREHVVKHSNQPFFAYLAFTVPHFPLHALPEDIARYRQRYLEGWDAIRSRRHERLLQLGIVTGPLPPMEPDKVPAWNLPDPVREISSNEVARAVAWSDLTEGQKEFQATKMAIHAAMIDRMDREIGRVLGQLESSGLLENTVVMFASDNGASAEFINRGDRHDPAAEPGSAGSYLCLGPGWSTACNTPFRLHKSWVHEGGISTPLIVHWPRGIRARGELRHAVGHVIDIVPTVLELVGASADTPWNGTHPPPLPGRSLVPVFHADLDVPRDYLYFHHSGHRALRVGQWKLVSNGAGEKVDGPADAPVPNEYALYDLSRDRSEQTDLSGEHPERVASMARLWADVDRGFREIARAEVTPVSPSAGTANQKAGD